MYSNVKSTDLPLELFSTLVFFWNVIVFLFYIPDGSRCYCTLYLTTRCFMKLLYKWVYIGVGFGKEKIELETRSDRDKD